MSVNARALHYVFKIGNRGKNAFFFRNVLGMKILRHEEFKEGCEAQCNGPYDNRWSKTMVGYGPESSHFVIELTYNYGLKSYEMGNDFGGITIKSKDIVNRAKSNNYPIEEKENYHLIKSPDGYKFFILNENQSNDNDDPITKITFNSSNLEKSINYWNGILVMKILQKNSNNCLLTYGDKQINLEIQQITETINRAKAYGRIAFAIPYNQQEYIDEIIKKNNQKILTPLISLDTPGKATVRVIILADPDGHEICFVDDEGFSELSQFDPESDKMLDKYIEKDPFEEK